MIGLVRQRYTPFGGAERILTRTIQALHQSGMGVHLFTRAWPHTSQEHPSDLPDQISLCNPRYFSKVGREKKFAEAVHAAVKRSELAFVQTHERIPGFEIYRAGDGVHATWLDLCAQAAGKKNVWSQQLNPFHHYLLRTERALFTHPKLKAVICNSHLVQQDIHQRFGLALAQLPVVRNGVDSDYFQPTSDSAKRLRWREQLAIPATAQVFLLVGSGFARKGVLRLLELWQALPSHAWLVVVGDDRHFKQAQQRAQQLGRVRLVGAQTEIRPYYQMADCFVLPTLYDPFPNAVLEAMACGLPIITTTTCGAAEWLDPQRGWVVPVLQRTALIQALQEASALSHAQLRQRGQAARAAVVPYSLAHFGQALQQVYQTLA